MVDLAVHKVLLSRLSWLTSHPWSRQLGRALIGKVASHATLEARTEVTVALSLLVGRVLLILVCGARWLLEIWAGCLWIIGALRLVIRA